MAKTAQSEAGRELLMLEMRQILKPHIRWTFHRERGDWSWYGSSFSGVSWGVKTPDDSEISGWFRERWKTQ